MVLIQCVHLNFEENSFYGRAFDAEILHHFMDLEIEEVTQLGLSVNREPPEESHFFQYSDADLAEARFTNVLQVLEHCDMGNYISVVNIQFKEGIVFNFINCEVWIDTKTSEQLMHYVTIILKQYGVYPERILELTRQYPNHDLYIDRPGILTALHDKSKGHDGFRFVYRHTDPNPHTNADTPPNSPGQPGT